MPSFAGFELRWLERSPDKTEVPGSSPGRPTPPRGRSLVGRAPPLHGGGQGFESPRLHWEIPSLATQTGCITCPVCTSRWGGDYSERETPVPIPNTVVKPFSSDDTVGVAPWENWTSPLHPPVWAGFFYAVHCGEKCYSRSRNFA